MPLCITKGVLAIICSISLSNCHGGEPEENSSDFSNAKPFTITCTLDAFIKYQDMQVCVFSRMLQIPF